MDEIAGDRNATITEIRKALRTRSGKTWSVKGGRGTAWGWITITAPPARLVLGSMTDEDRAELSALLGTDVHHQGASIPASTDYRREYLDRAHGRTPAVVAAPYWD